jgi:hypothetical protein
MGDPRRPARFGWWTFSSADEDRRAAFASLGLPRGSEGWFVAKAGGFMATFSALRRGLTLALFSFATAALSECSTMPNNRANFETAPPKPRFAALYIGRPAGSNVSVFPVPIELDGRPLVSLGPNDYTRIELPAGLHKIEVPDNTWTRAINYTPHPVNLTVEAGKSYYLLPIDWAGASHLQVTMVDNAAVPETVAEGHSSFSVETVSSGGPAPSQFHNLIYVAPGQN